MKHSIDELESKLAKVTTTANEGLEMAKKLWQMHDALEKCMADQENGLNRHSSTQQNPTQEQKHNPRYFHAKFAQKDEKKGYPEKTTGSKIT